MHGNVLELCSDILPGYNKISDVDPVGRLIDPKPFTGPRNTTSGSGALRRGETGELGKVRSGSYRQDADSCRAAWRAYALDRWVPVGFRICIEPRRPDDERPRPTRGKNHEDPGGKSNEDPFREIPPP
jgi:formylglycine-generating enzyme required for sulfatase activity